MQFLEECARQAAKRWIEHRVMAGQTPEVIAGDFCGSRDGRLDIQIKGFAYHEGRGVEVKRGHVAVFKIGGIPCVYQFSIEQLASEILRPDEVGVQVSLF